MSSHSKFDFVAIESCKRWKSLPRLMWPGPGSNRKPLGSKRPEVHHAVWLPHSICMPTGPCMESRILFLPTIGSRS
jgi:hypothetical protein